MMCSLSASIFKRKIMKVKTLLKHIPNDILISARAEYFKIYKYLPVYK